MSLFFSLDEINHKQESTDRLLIADKFLSVHERKIESIKDLTGRLPVESEIFFLWTLNSFNAFTFIPYVIKECSLITELVISTYSINSRIVDSLMKYVDKGKIANVSILISDSLKSRMPAVVDHLLSLVDQRNNIDVSFGWNHSKITLMKTDHGHFCVEGSGNWSENSKNEQYIFLNSKQVYEYRYSCIKTSVNS